MKTLTLIIALVALAISLKPHLFGYGEVVCDGWSVVDKDGKERIAAATSADGLAYVMWFDKDEKLRITASTHADGLASVKWFDKDEKERIDAATHADGLASVLWFDKDGKQRITAATFADGTVALPTKDLKVVFATDPQNDRDTAPKAAADDIDLDSCAILHYNDGEYQLTDGDIPGLEGCGVIIIQVMGGMSQSHISGFTRGQCNVSQINGQTFVNDVDIAELVERLKSR